MIPVPVETAGHGLPDGLPAGPGCAHGLPGNGIPRAWPGR